MDRDWKTFEEVSAGAYQSMLDQWELNYDLSIASNYFGKLQAIKKYYNKKEADILEMFRRSKRGWAITYPTNWLDIFTPIEFMAWQSIRCKGVPVFYPQYPVLNYFVDFGNPGLKIALELDGAGYHNRQKDIERDKQLLKAGWTVYRVTGSEMNNLDYKDYNTLYDEDITDEYEVAGHIKHWICNTGDGVIEAIKNIYFLNRDEDEESDEDRQFFSYCQQSLRQHKII